MLVHKVIEGAEVQPRVVAPLQDELDVARDVVLLRSRLERTPESLDLPVEALIQITLELAHEIRAGDLREQYCVDGVRKMSRTPPLHLVDVLALALQL